MDLNKRKEVSNLDSVYTPSFDEEEGFDEEPQQFPPSTRIVITPREADAPFLGLRPEDGSCAARAQGTHLEVNHPQRGWTRFQIEGELNSWHRAWDDDKIDIYIFERERKWMVKAWEDFRSYLERAPR